MIRRLARAFARVALLAVILVIAVAVSGATIAAHNEQTQRAEYPAAGQLVDIGSGQVIHLRTWGTRTPGEAAVILDSSAGMPSSEWAWVAAQLAEHHFVVAYDRPGIAWSTGPAAPRDAVASANALEMALTGAGIAPPFVVVAHSFGGLSARAFVGARPDQVSGLVLLDTTDADAGGINGFTAGYQLSAWRADFGLYALTGVPDDFWQLPVEEQAAANAASKWPSTLETTVAELQSADVSAAEVRLFDLSRVPLLVVCVPESAEHIALQRHIASLSNDSTFVEQPGYHMGILLDRDQAAQTAREIETFLSLPQFQSTVPDEAN